MEIFERPAELHLRRRWRSFFAPKFWRAVGLYKILKNPENLHLIWSFVNKWPNWKGDFRVFYPENIHFIWSFVDKWPNGKGDFRSFWRAVSLRKNSGRSGLGPPKKERSLFAGPIGMACRGRSAPQVYTHWPEACGEIHFIFISFSSIK